VWRVKDCLRSVYYSMLSRSSFYFLVANYVTSPQTFFSLLPISFIYPHSHTATLNSPYDQHTQPQRQPPYDFLGHLSIIPSIHPRADEHSSASAFHSRSHLSSSRLRFRRQSHGHLYFHALILPRRCHPSSYLHFPNPPVERTLPEPREKA
jgi:hypothetical protein